MQFLMCVGVCFCVWVSCGMWRSSGRWQMWCGSVLHAHQGVGGAWGAGTPVGGTVEAGEARREGGL